MSLVSHDSYFAAVEPAIKCRLVQIQEIVERLVPDAKRCVSYDMPAFRKEGVFLYFAAFKKHIGVYPPVTENLQLIEDLSPYRGPKGNLIFEHSKPLPIAIIGRVAVALATQYSHQDSKRS